MTLLVLTAASAVIVIALLYSAHRVLFLVTVSGRSMEPQYFHGDRVLAVRNGVLGTPRKGDVVVVRRPSKDSAEHRTTGKGGDGALFIKNVAAAPGDPVPRVFGGIGDADPRDVTPEHCFLVLGRHPASEDSKQWGYVARREIVGKALRPRDDRSSTRRQGKAGSE